MFYTKQIGVHYSRAGVYAVKVPQPPVGYSCYMIEKKGVYQLFTGSGMLFAVSCTHVGVGGVEIIDGVCDENGSMVGDSKILYKANPQTMCLWLMSAGVSRGLVVRALGGDMNSPVFMTVSWTEKKDGPTP